MPPKKQLATHKPKKIIKHVKWVDTNSMGLATIKDLYSYWINLLSFRFQFKSV